MPADTIHLFSTCPQSKDVARGDYLALVRRVAQWSEAAGCTGMLIYTDNSIVDPWLVAQLTLQATEQLCPLVAVQPVYMVPYTAAKMVASLGSLHNRRIWLNMLAGGFRNDLIALGDETPHDDRYARTVEYALLMRHCWRTTSPSRFEGRFYRVHGVRLAPRCRSTMQPGWLISGSSPAGRAAAVAMGRSPWSIRRRPMLPPATPTPHRTGRARRPRRHHRPRQRRRGLGCRACTLSR